MEPSSRSASLAPAAQTRGSGHRDGERRPRACHRSDCAPARRANRRPGTRITPAQPDPAFKLQVTGKLAVTGAPGLRLSESASAELAQAPGRRVPVIVGRPSCAVTARHGASGADCLCPGPLSWSRQLPAFAPPAVQIGGGGAPACRWRRGDRRCSQEAADGGGRRPTPGSQRQPARCRRRWRRGRPAAREFGRVKIGGLPLQERGGPRMSIGAWRRRIRRRPV